MSDPTQLLALRERPAGPPVMYQRWRGLLFAHWPLEPEAVARTLPPGLRVDTFEGRAWVGIVPFWMAGVRPRGCPPVPGISNFLELNLRTYVVDEAGVPGVWFYSLDASGWLAVTLARRLWGLPYYHASMSGHLRADGTHVFTSTRRGARHTVAETFQYRPMGEAFTARPGSLECFLVERYALYSKAGHAEAVSRGEPPPGHAPLRRGRVWHAPYELRNVDPDDFQCTRGLFAQAGLPPPLNPPGHCVFAPGVNVQAFRPAPVSRA